MFHDMTRSRRPALPTSMSYSPGSGNCRLALTGMTAGPHCGCTWCVACTGHRLTHVLGCPGSRGSSRAHLRIRRATCTVQDTWQGDDDLGAFPRRHRVPANTHDMGLITALSESAWREETCCSCSQSSGAGDTPLLKKAFPFGASSSSCQDVSTQAPTRAAGGHWQQHFNVGRGLQCCCGLLWATWGHGTPMLPWIAWDRGYRCKIQVGF